MRKELLLAIGIGSIMGLMVAFGIWRANKALTKDIPQNTNAKNTIAPIALSGSSTPTPNNTKLTIVKPEADEVFTSSEAKIDGITIPNSLVVIASEDADYFQQTDNSGNFSFNVTLLGGINNILITSFHPDFTYSKKDITTIFTTELSPLTESSTDTLQASDSVRQKIQQKLDLASNKPIAFLGVVTDKTETGLQLKNKSGEIKQSSVLEGQTSFVRLGKTNKNVDFTDVGIGDYVVAIGYRNVSGVLDARRVLITTAPNLSAKQIVRGTITQSAKTKVTLNYDEKTATINSSSSQKIFVVNKNDIVSAKFSSLNSQDQVIVSGEINDSIITSRSIFITSNSTPEPTPR